MKYIFLLLAILTLNCSSVEKNESVSSVSQEFHSWSTYHWYRNNDQVSLNLSRNLSSEWVPYLNTASTDWNLSSVIETTVVVGAQSPKRCKPVLGRVEVCNSTYGKNGWLGLAQIWISNGHIVQAVTKMNDSYFSMAKYNTVSYRHLVMCQEIGHTFGLDHQDENQTNANLGTCMDYTNNPSGPLSNEHPNAHDYEQLETIYAHDDEVNSSAVSEVNDSEPNYWGELISDGEHSKKFVHKFGNNGYVITHVLLADD